MASAIMDMKNYGNENTNTMTAEEWLRQKDSEGIFYANTLFDKMWDYITNKKISSLDPRLQNPSADFINDVKDNLGISLRIIQGYRSIEEQNNLYSKGRDASGKVVNKKDVVTNAKGGQSYHNYGLEIDVVAMENNNRKTNFNVVPSNSVLVDIGRSYGIQWGGDFKSIKAYPHLSDSKK
jgi:peptidoglycan L-alanyl-D-glutamate endopeptidase CwlK